MADNSAKLTAADVMTTDVRTCAPQSTVLEAVMIFRDADCGAVPIIRDGKPVGMVTDRDVALALAEYEDLQARPISDIMTEGVVSVPPGASLETVCEMFGDKGVRRLMVLDEKEQILGIIGWADVAPKIKDQKLGQTVTEVVERP